MDKALRYVAAALAATAVILFVLSISGCGDAGETTCDKCVTPAPGACIEGRCEK